MRRWGGDDLFAGSRTTSRLERFGDKIETDGKNSRRVFDGSTSGGAVAGVVEDVLDGDRGCLLAELRQNAEISAHATRFMNVL